MVTKGGLQTHFSAISFASSLVWCDILTLTSDAEEVPPFTCSSLWLLSFLLWTWRPSTSALSQWSISWALLALPGLFCLPRHDLNSSPHSSQNTLWNTCISHFNFQLGLVRMSLSLMKLHRGKQEALSSFFYWSQWQEWVARAMALGDPGITGEDARVSEDSLC